MKTQEFVFSETEIRTVAEKVLMIISKDRPILVSGEMGAGKTTFIKGICAQLGCASEVSSPSFSIINEYACGLNKWGLNRIVHMDLYRIEKMEDIYDIGVPDYLESGIPVFIEWPDLIKPLLKGQPVIEIQFEVLDNLNRKIILTF
ncbi:MAG: tRNA (adenosine(37)-N6)-threonylcarbamoyltransferase complex ATPase subunit type 1 TsaE [Saprospiraceae bacterium]|nr:tRNA (adenosine(37)-N6)-threonylcarbamoyltransferase complex ATPase subunit type 1 TsaE [Saprospiraceae bacterium]